MVVLDTFAAIPIEIMIKIFSYLDIESIASFRLVSKRLHAISASPAAQGDFLLNNYGKGLALFNGYYRHKPFFNAELFQILVNNQALVPRFLIQLVVTNVFRTNFSTIALGSIIMILIYMQASLGLDFSYMTSAQISLEMLIILPKDPREFERLVRSPWTNDLEERSSALEELIKKYKFIPLSELASRPLHESIFNLCKMNLSLINDLKSNGFSLAKVNDNVMERLMNHPYFNLRYLNSFLDVGFSMNDLVIKRAIAASRKRVINVLQSVLAPEKLQVYVEETIYQLFGPNLSYKTSLNTTWSSDKIEYLMETFNISEEFLVKCILTHPESDYSLEMPRPEFPSTRPYLKTSPYIVWQWILDRFGPHHEFSIAVMDDALSRAVSEEELHRLHDNFIEAGFILRPRHIKILACRVLHRNMTQNALHLMRHMRQQVVDRQLQTIVASSSVTPSDTLPSISLAESIAFRIALNREILQNEEWRHRLATIQLEGGVRGGAHMLFGAPEDGLKFFDEVQKFDSELQSAQIPINFPPNFQVDERRGVSIDSCHELEDPPRSKSMVTRMKKYVFVM